MEYIQFDSARARKFVLDTIDYRIPNMNELYINKNGLIQRRKHENTSRRGCKRIIVRESWIVNPYRRKIK